MNAYEITIIDNYHRPCVDDSLAQLDRVTFLRMDVRDGSSVTAAMRGCDVVFHLAAQSNVMGAVHNADYAFGSNVTGTFNVLRAAAAARAKRVVFTSSREVYGDPKLLPVRETSLLRPKNIYGVSKAAAEVICSAATNEGIETVILRLANVYGARDRDRVIPLFVRAAELGTPLTLYGGAQVIDFVWIDTVVDALVKAAFGPWIRKPVNIGSGTGVTVSELAESVIRLTGSRSLIHNTGQRKEEVARFIADITYATKVLGIPRPKAPLAQLPTLLSSMRHHEGTARRYTQ